jgi:hypothetical protein
MNRTACSNNGRRWGLEKKLLFLAGAAPDAAIAN